MPHRSQISLAGVQQVNSGVRPITLVRGCANGSVSLRLVDLDTAASLLENFLAALEAPAQYRDVQLDYARIRAVRQLQEWGVERQPLEQGDALSGWQA